jgi:hypothetical protein
MRFCSTPESAAKGEITFLAIVETLVAIAISVLLAKALDSGAHIVISTLIAPFLLLRTESSMTRAFNMFDSFFAKLTGVVSFIERFYQRLSDERAAAVRSFAFVFVWLPLFSLVGVAVRFMAAAASLISSPRETLLAIPGNWVRIALATDHRHPPELFPGIETAEEAPAAARTFRYEEIRNQINSGTGGTVFRKMSLFGIYAPAVIFRLFLKSTSLIYFPLIWLVDLPLTGKGILSSPLERARRWYASALILIMLSPVVISFPVVQQTMATARDRAIFTYVLPVNTTDWWHITRVVAVGVTIALWFSARKLEHYSVQHPQQALWIITRANWLRGACALFTMGCFILIVLAL